MVIATPAGAPEEANGSLPDHLAYQAKLERPGALAIAGLLSDESGDEMQGMGLMVYQTESLDVARQLVENSSMQRPGPHHLQFTTLDDQRRVT